MMKKTNLSSRIALIFVASLLSSEFVQAQTARNNKARSVKTMPEATRSVASPRRNLDDAIRMVKGGRAEAGINRLFQLSRDRSQAANRSEIKYWLGVGMMELKWNQTAAFQFVEVIRAGGSKFVADAIEKLSIVADELGNDALLNYAITKVRVEQFPGSNQDIIYFRLGEIKMKAEQFVDAAQAFARVQPGSRYYGQALFNRGLAFMEAKQPDRAIPVFNALIRSRSQEGVTDTNRVAGVLGLARAQYQAQQWENAIATYRRVPRDTEFWHDALFEQSWAYMRAAKFRSALSNFQTLHSSYYDEVYQPESLVLRSLIFLFICKYDEMEKVLNLFESEYSPINNRMGSVLASKKDATFFASEIEKTELVRLGKGKKENLQIPYIVMRRILKEGDVKRSISYLKKLSEEIDRINRNSSLSKSAIGRYATKVVAGRVKNTRVILGESVRYHLARLRNELNDHFEQASFARYEMIGGQKEILQKRIAGKTLPSGQSSEDRRDFYVQNGYEYWPFKGEFWLDELGNYQYLGQQSCE